MSGAALVTRLRALLPQRMVSLWYAPIAALAMALLFVRLVVYAAWFDVDEFATFSAGLLLSGLLSIVGFLGLQSLVQREFPILAVHRRMRAAMVVLLQAAIVAVVVSLLAGLVTLAGLAWPGLEQMPALAAVVHGLVQQLFLLYTIEARSHGSPMRFASHALVRAVLLVLAGSAAARGTGSATITLIVESVAGFALLVSLAPAAARRNGFGLIKALTLALKRMPRVPWRQALTLLAAALLIYLLSNADRWIAGAMLDRDGFAVYSFGWILLLAAGQAQVIVNSAAFPWMSRRVARAGRAAGLASTGLLSALMFILAAVAMAPVLLVADWAIPRYWPHLSAVIELLPILATCAVLRLSDFWSSFLIVTGSERRLVVNALVVCTVVPVAWFSLMTWREFGVTTQSVAWLCLSLSAAGYLSSAAACLRAPRDAPC